MDQDILYANLIMCLPIDTSREMGLLNTYLNGCTPIGSLDRFNSCASFGWMWIGDVLYYMFFS